MNKNNSTIFLKIMSILIVKKNFKEKTVISKVNFVLLLFIFAITFSFLGILNNQKNVFADEKIAGELDCGKEIPLGEAIEKTNDLLYDVIQGLESIYDNANYQIAAAEEAISLANQCDISVCQPVNCGGYKTYYSCPPCLFTDPEEPLRCLQWSTCSTDHCYFSQPCTSPWNGYACPQSSIESQFNSVQSSYNSIESSKNKIINLIDDNNEFLCDKLNEDIRGSTRCSQACLLNPGAAGCPKINVREAIRRKLYLARNEFDKCYVPPVDWAKILRGELSGKMLFPCSSVVQEEGGLSYYTKTTEKKDGKDIFLCTNNHNWFCCFSYGLESFLSSCSWVSGSNCPQGLLPADYRDCSNRSIRGMTCCCPDFDISLEPKPGQETTILTEVTIGNTSQNCFNRCENIGQEWRCLNAGTNPEATNQKYWHLGIKTDERDMNTSPCFFIHQQRVESKTNCLCVK